MKKALSAPDADELLEPIQEEKHGLWGKGRFKDEESQLNIKPIKTRFVYRLKRGADGDVKRHKAAIVIRGFTQHPGLEFFETFSPVTGFDVVRNVLAILPRSDGTFEHWTLSKHSRILHYLRIYG